MKVVLSLVVLLWAIPAEAASLGGIVREIKAQCGAKVISGYRATRIFGGSWSCHAMNQAVDVSGNYACIYRVLRKWPGGYSTDAQRCRHIHISSCKREWGLRFRHRTC